MRPAVVIDNPATGGDDVVVELATTYGWHADVQDRWKDHGRYGGPVGGCGDVVLRSENRCKIRIFTILYTQAVDK